MTLADQLGLGLDLRVALSLGTLVALVAALVGTPRAIRKLRGAGIVGRDIHKPGRPEVPEMGGLAVFVAFNVGAFTALGFGDLAPAQESLVLAALVVSAGACITGVLDDLIVMRQRFKAILPIAFAAPLALYVPQTAVDFPVLGMVDFGLFYALVLVPLGIASASNGFNMLEGFNGLGTGLGIILAGAVSIMALATDDLATLAITMPLIGALGGFLWFNAYPSRVFPGDTMTLLAGAALGTAIIIGRLELWGALLFLPHVVEFVLKATGAFNVQSFATGIEGGRMHYVGPTRSLTHVFMKWRPMTEGRLVATMWIAEGVWAGLVLLGFFASRPGGLI